MDAEEEIDALLPSQQVEEFYCSLWNARAYLIRADLLARRLGLIDYLLKPAEIDRARQGELILRDIKTGLRP